MDAMVAIGSKTTITRKTGAAVAAVAAAETKAQTEAN